ncbi:hypothetical protein EMIT0P291_110042 [Pseudomonas sp. IT-P291]
MKVALLLFRPIPSDIPWSVYGKLYIIVQTEFLMLIDSDFCHRATSSLSVREVSISRLVMESRRSIY